MTLVAGCDVGSLTSKAVIMKDNGLVGIGVVKSLADPRNSADAAMTLALENAGVQLSDIEYCVGTGYGRERISFVNEARSQIACHGKGALWLVPSVRTVIDIGGQDCKVIRIDKDGVVEKFITNDKCASGTGRFLEIMADALGVPLEDMGSLSEESTEKLTISNQCVIFAETEVVSLINERKKPQDIARALHKALASRVASLAKSIGVDQDIVMTGGVAKNSGVFKALSEGLGLPVKSLPDMDPQINGALGAALIAGEMMKK